MFENIMKLFKRPSKKEGKVSNNSRDAAKERLHLVLMQDRANVSADFLELMKQEIIDVIKKYIDVDENAIDVRLTNKENDDGTNGAPALYANIPILNIKNEARKVETKKEENKKEIKEENKKEIKEEDKKEIKEEDKKEIKEEVKQKEDNNELDNKEDNIKRQEENLENKIEEKDSKEEIKSEN